LYPMLQPYIYLVKFRHATLRRKENLHQMNHQISSL
jgi:hypothetical protein